MRVAFLGTVGACALIAGITGACGAPDNSFGVDDASSSGSSSGGSSSGATSSTCPSVCSSNSQCQTSCGAAPTGSVYCCDTTATKLCFQSSTGSCTATTAPVDAAAPRDATSGPGVDAAPPPPACTGTASCGGGQVCCRRTGAAAACARTCGAGTTQVCADDGDCPANEVCRAAGGFGGGGMTCQNPPVMIDAAPPPVDAAARDAMLDAIPDAIPDAIREAAPDAPRTVEDAAGDAPAEASNPIDSGNVSDAPSGG